MDNLRNKNLLTKINKLTSILEKHQIDDNIKTLILDDYIKELSPKSKK